MLLYLLGAYQVAVIELSVGAGLVTVLLIYAISVVGDDAFDPGPVIPRPVAVGLTLLTVLYGAAITAVFTVIPKLGAASKTAALNFEPIAVLGLAWIILDQSVAPGQIVGAFVVVGAIILLNTGKR